MKNNKGITLIALVITIIVLLILVGVTLAMITGENSIFSKAGEASIKTKVAQGKELAAVLASDAVTDYYNAKYLNAEGTTLTITEYVQNHFKTLSEEDGGKAPEFQKILEYDDGTKTISVIGTTSKATVGGKGQLVWTGET